MMAEGLSNKKSFNIVLPDRVYPATAYRESFCLDLYVNTFYKEQINSGDSGYGNISCCWSVDF